jgi:hypothetical protein
MRTQYNTSWVSSKGTCPMMRAVRGVAMVIKEEVSDATSAMGGNKM